jgi:hypothetical protein
MPLRRLDGNGFGAAADPLIDAAVSNNGLLETLSLRGCDVSQLPSSLASLDHLQRLDVADNPLVFPPRRVLRTGIAAIKACVAGGGVDVEGSSGTRSGEGSPSAAASVSRTARNCVVISRDVFQ